MKELAFSQACENNKDFILDVLLRLFAETKTVLEVGSGTGQHAVHFATHLEHTIWQTADQPDYHPTIVGRLNRAGLPNLRYPISLEAVSFDWDSHRSDGYFSANTAHIMAWHAVEAMFTGIGSGLENGVFVLYGPFNRNGEFTSATNLQFDQSLRARNSEMGIRDDQALISLGQQSGLVLAEDLEMPANNRILVWRTKAA